MCDSLTLASIYRNRASTLRVCDFFGGDGFNEHVVAYYRHLAVLADAA